MPSIFITDFKFGIDRRGKRVSGIPGTLWDGKNVHINRRGEIERPFKFATAYALPAGTFGLGAVRGQLYVFGSAASPVGLPSGVQYQRLQAPGAEAMTEIIDVRSAGGKLYVIARFATGNIYHYYDGVRVTDWDALADANCDIKTTAAFLAEQINGDSAVTAIAAGATLTLTASVPGTDFTITKTTVNQGGGVNDQDITLTTLQANVAGVAEVLATATVTITGGTFSAGINRVSGITANAVQLLKAAVNWTGSNASTANAVASQINNLSTTHGYTAVAVNNVVTIKAAPGTGATPNGYVVAVTAAGNVTTSKTNFAGGVTTVVAIAKVVTAVLSGTFESQDQFTLTINGTAYTVTGRASGMGTSAFVFKRRIFSTASSLWEYCKLNTFTNWNDATASSGSGFLNISNESEGTERLVGAAIYGTLAAVFSRRNSRIYTISTDSAQFALSQPVDNSGCAAARSLLNYGNIDLYYLSDVGIRSLRANQLSGQPSVNTVGEAIDPFVRAQLDTLTDSVIQHAAAAIEPREGRFWLAVGARIYVLSYFPLSNVSAWTYYEPGFSVSHFARAYNRLYMRAADTIYLYGGTSGTQQPADNELVASVQLPYVSTPPPVMEHLRAFDVALTGEWQFDVLTDPNNEAAAVRAGKINSITYNDGAISIPGDTKFVALNFSCSKAGSATISHMAIHYTPEIDKR